MLLCEAFPALEPSVPLESLVHRPLTDDSLIVFVLYIVLQIQTFLTAYKIWC